MCKITKENFNMMTDTLHLLFWESVRSIGQWSDTLTTHISIDQNDHSYIIQF